jgi:hypothetical protein
MDARGVSARVRSPLIWPRLASALRQCLATGGGVLGLGGAVGGLVVLGEAPAWSARHGGGPDLGGAMGLVGPCWASCGGAMGAAAAGRSGHRGDVLVACSRRSQAGGGLLVGGGHWRFAPPPWPTCSRGRGEAGAAAPKQRQRLEWWLDCVSGKFPPEKRMPGRRPWV